MVNIQIQGQQVVGNYDEYTPIAEGTYQVNITEASFEVGQTKDTASKHFGKERTLLKMKFDVYNAKQDGGSRPYWETLVIDHSASQSDEKIRAFVGKNQQKATDIALQVIAKNPQAGASFAQGLNDQSVASMVNSTISIELGINKKNGENFVKSFYPADALQQPQQAYQQPQQNYQQPQQQVQQNAGNVHQQTQPVQHSQPAAVQQTAASPFNQGRPAFMTPQGQRA